MPYTHNSQHQPRGNDGRFRNTTPAAPTASPAAYQAAPVPQAPDTGQAVTAAYSRFTTTLLRPGPAAERLGVSVSTLRRWVSEGLLPAVRLPSGHMRYRAADIDAIAANLPDGPDFLDDWDADW